MTAIDSRANILKEHLKKVGILTINGDITVYGFWEVLHPVSPTPENNKKRNIF